MKLITLSYLFQLSYFHYLLMSLSNIDYLFLELILFLIVKIINQIVRILSD